MNQPIEGITVPFEYTGGNNDVADMINKQGQQPGVVYQAALKFAKAKANFVDVKKNYDECYGKVYLVTAGKTVLDRDILTKQDEEVEARYLALVKFQGLLAEAEAKYEEAKNSLEVMKSQTILLNQMLRNQL
jgi:predicted nuclease with TOPRIM domain